MKRIKFYLTSFILITVLISCSNDDDSTSKVDDNGILVTDMTLSSQNAFVDEIINLDFNTEGQDSLNVMTNVNNLDITELTQTSYEITSSVAASGFIDMTFYRDTISELQQVFVNFHEHGVAGNVVEGIEMDGDNRNYLELLLGEPEGKYLVNQNIQNPDDPDQQQLIYQESWSYLSKGVAFAVSLTGNVTSAELFGTSWSAIDNDYGESEESIIISGGEPYSYDIDGLGNFTDPEGITMDAVIEKYGLPEEEGGKRAGEGEGETLQTYFYPGEINVYFVSDDIDNYQGKEVIRVTIL